MTTPSATQRLVSTWFARLTCVGIWAACSQSDSGTNVPPAGSSGAPVGTAGAAGMPGRQGGSGGAAGMGGAAGSATGSGGSSGSADDGGVDAGSPTISPFDVLQYHKSASRDGLYVDAAFTKASAAKMHRDATFSATIQGPTYAQPLYFAEGPGGKELVIVATERNLVYALDAATGALVWQTKLLGDPNDEPVPRAQMPCGGAVDPFGVTGTPVIDPRSRSLFVDGMMSADGGVTKRHKIFALSLDDGSVRAGWPVDMSTVQVGTTAFQSQYQSQRAALAFLDGMVYVPYGGLGGDCGDYHGWVVGVPAENPAAPKFFVTTAAKSGIWGPGGIASDGTSLFVTTGNAPPQSPWGHQEAVLRLQPGAVFSGATVDYFAPSDWALLDSSDLDLGAAGPVLVDVPGATPSKLVVALGKDGVVHLLDRANLGGFGKGNGITGEGLASAHLSSTAMITGATAYTTSQGTYVVGFGTGIGCPPSSNLLAVKISATNPPVPSVAWCAQYGGYGAPIVTTVDGHAEAIVWVVATSLRNQLLGFDGDTGAPVFNGGAASDAVGSVSSKFGTPIAVKGRIFAATDVIVQAFTME